MGTPLADRGNNLPTSLRVGDRVSYKMKEFTRTGFVRWVGVLPKELTSGGGGGGVGGGKLAPSIPVYAGVEFLEPVGSGNGSVKVKAEGSEQFQTIRYFKCPKNHAAFVKLSSLSKIEGDNNNRHRRHNDSTGSSIGSCLSSLGSFGALSLSPSPTVDDFFDPGEIFVSDDDMDAILADCGPQQLQQQQQQQRSKSDRPAGKTVAATKSKKEGERKKGVAMAKGGRSVVGERTDSEEGPKAKSVVELAKTAEMDRVVHPVFERVDRPTITPPRRKPTPVLAISKCATKLTAPPLASSATSTTSSYSSSTPSSTASKVPTNYKSVVCHFWQQTGKCSNGASCSFAHGLDEKRFWDHELRKGASRGAAGGGCFYYRDVDSEEDDDVRVVRVKKTYRNDGQFSSQAFAKDKQDVRKGGRTLSHLSK